MDDNNNAASKRKHEVQNENYSTKSSKTFTVNSATAARHLDPKKLDITKCFFPDPVRKIRDWKFIECSTSSTPTQIKVELLGTINAVTPTQELTHPENWILKVAGINYCLVNESLALQRTPIFQLCRKYCSVPVLLVVPKSQQMDPISIEIAEELGTQKEITSLIGNSMDMISSPESLEFRAAVTQLIMLEKSNTTEPNAALQEFFLTDPWSAEEMIESNNNSANENSGKGLKLACLFPTGETFTVEWSTNDTVSELKSKIFTKYSRVDLNNTKNKSVDDYVIKVLGRDEYLITSQKKLLDYDYIRRCLMKNQTIKVVLIEEAACKKLPSQEKFSVVNNILCDLPNYASQMKEFDYFSLNEVQRPFQLKCTGAENVPKSIPNPNKEGKEDIALHNRKLFVVMNLTHGDRIISGPLFSNMVDWSTDPRWNTWIISPSPLSSLPKATRICITLYSRAGNDSASEIQKTDLPLGWVNVSLIDYRGLLQTGVRSLRLWSDGNEANIISSPVENFSHPNPIQLFIQFPDFVNPVKFVEDDSATMAPTETNAPKVLKDEVVKILNKDSLSKLKPDRQVLIWSNREYCMKLPRGLAKVMQACSWNIPDQVKEAHRLLSVAEPLHPLQALELLDAKFGDEKVRSFAVKCLEKLEDDQIAFLLLQLVQVLKYEPYHDSALARFLIRRALKNPYQVGHYLYWHLKSEMHVPEIAERFGIILEIFLRNCGKNFRMELLKQVEVVNKLKVVADSIRTSNVSDKKEFLIGQLKNLNLPPRFRLPLDPRLEVAGFVFDKCKSMKSKKQPLYLVFQNSDPLGDTVTVLFKSGDDLRQDVLSLQMIRLMDGLWSHEGLNMCMQPYDVVATGDNIGMLEIVLNAETTATINQESGGVLALLKDEVMANWLRKCNPSDAEFAAATETFMWSCAGYCVATFVLGIGDRHNDNIMVTKRGHLFHIDFGHFLGHFKKKFGYEREKAPFVFTPQYAGILNADKTKGLYKRFEDTCCTAYNIVRKHPHLFINLFALMLSTGIPELRSAKDIKYLREHMSLSMKDEDASTFFKQKIEESLKSKRTQFNDFAHMWKNKKKNPLLDKFILRNIGFLG